MYVLTSFDAYIFKIFHFITNLINWVSELNVVKSVKSMKFTKFKILQKFFNFGHTNHKIDFIRHKEPI